jgi:AmiR/NasT family two-component response regulator
VGIETQRDALAAAIAERFPALLAQYSQFTVADFIVKHFKSSILANAVSMVKNMGDACDTLRTERDEVRRDLVNARSEQIRLSLAVLVLEQERDEARAARGGGQ